MENKKLKRDVISVLNYFDTFNIPFNDDLLAQSWKDIKDGLQIGIDDPQEVAENIVDILSRMVANGNADSAIEEFYTQITNDLEDCLNEGVFSNNNAILKSRIDQLEKKLNAVNSEVEDINKNEEDNTGNDNAFNKDEDDGTLDEFFNQMHLRESLQQDLYSDKIFMLGNLNATEDQLDEFLDITGYSLNEVLYRESVCKEFMNFLNDSPGLDDEQIYDNDIDDYLDSSENNTTYAFVESLLNDIDDNTYNKYDLLNQFHSIKVNESVLTNLKNMILSNNSAKQLHEAMFDYDDDDEFDLDNKFELIDRKRIEDFDGFMTEYSMYRSEDGKYVFVYGDSDIYRPEDGDFDYECDSEEEAYDWFDNYNLEENYKCKAIDEDYYHDYSCLDEPHYQVTAYYTKVNNHDFVGIEDDYCTDNCEDADHWAWDKLCKGMYVCIQTPQNEFKYYSPDALSADTYSLDQLQE